MPSPVLTLVLPKMTHHVFSCSRSECYRMRRWGWSLFPQKGWQEMPVWGNWGSCRYTQVTGSLCQPSARIRWHRASPVKWLLAWQDVNSLGIVKECCKVLAFVFRLRKFFKIDWQDIKWNLKNIEICVTKSTLCMRKRFAKWQLFKNRQFYSCMKMLKDTKGKERHFTSLYDIFKCCLLNSPQSSLSSRAKAPDNRCHRAQRICREVKQYLRGAQFLP